MNDKIMNHVPIRALVEQYNKIKSRIDVIFENIDAVDKECDEAIGRTYVLDHHLRSAGCQGNQHSLRKYFWKYACDKLQLYNLMSVKKRDEFDKQLEDENLPDFTLENVHNTFQCLIDNIGNLAEDAILEAFELFRPRNDHYKTNTQFEVKKRAILEYMIDAPVYGGKRCHPSLSYTRDKYLRIMDNAFSLMDGKGPTKHPGDSYTILREAIGKKQQECETDYFKFKWHLNGTLHVMFKRLDLLQRMNEIGGKGLLRQPKEDAA